ncbi:hypothetical protein QP923_11205, partial [Corynebacterium sp. MSK151]|uniref:hypothetical protein n=1 Tax=Corynebacterium sp. MSK151 TaxID=3050210 RepID=UPI00254EEB1B
IYFPETYRSIRENPRFRTHFLTLNPDLQCMPGAAGRRGTVMDAVMDAVTKLVTNPWWQRPD